MAGVSRKLHDTSLRVDVEDDSTLSSEERLACLRAIAPCDTRPCYKQWTLKVTVVKANELLVADSILDGGLSDPMVIAARPSSSCPFDRRASLRQSTVCSLFGDAAIILTAFSFYHLLLK